MADEKFPVLDPAALDSTRQAIHAYARVAGAWGKATRMKRKHWWHASLRPSLCGLTTGIIRGGTDFEIELDLAGSRIIVRTCTSTVGERLRGQSSEQVAETIRNALLAGGVDECLAQGTDVATDEEYLGYSVEQATLMQRTIGSVSAALEDFRATTREETSPIQIWPHHFDVSMIWLPGHKVPDQDAADEEYADKQMNFGFVFGDENFPEPYFYVSAYPLPDALPKVVLPAGATWESEGFSGAVFLYKDLVTMKHPAAYLQELWSTLLAAGQAHLATNESRG